MSNNTEPKKPIKNLIDFDLLTYYSSKLKTYLTTLLNKKQDTLDSTNIKSINGECILGSGDIKAGNPNANVEAVDTSDIIDDIISNENSNYELPIASLNTLGGVKVGTKMNPNIDQAVMNINETTGEIGINLCSGLSSHSRYGLGVKYGSGLGINNDGQLYVPAATTETLGGVKIGSGLMIGSDGTINAIPGGSSYTLPVASSSTLGGVKIGSGLSIGSDGTLTASGGGSNLPKANYETLGCVKIGTKSDTRGLQIDGFGQLGILCGVNSGVKINNGMLVVDYGTGLSIDNGKLCVAGGGSGYELPIASSTTLGGVKIGSGLLLSSDGRIDAIPGGGSNYQLPIASDTTLGGVKIGTGSDARGLGISYGGQLCINIGDGLSTNIANKQGKLCVNCGLGLGTDVYGKLEVKCGTDLSNNNVLIGVNNAGSIGVNYGDGIKNDGYHRLVPDIDYIYQQILTKLQNDGHLQ